MAIVTDGLVGYWHYAQGVNGSTWSNIAPATVGSYNGTISGATLQSEGMYFDGVDDIINFPSLGVTGSFTIDYILSSELYGRVPYYMGGSNYGFLRSPNNRHDFIMGIMVNPPDNTFLLNTINTVSVTYESSSNSIKMYNAGILAKTTSGTPDKPNTNWKMGSYSSGSFFKGKIIGFRVYNRPLTDAEVAQNYAVGTEVGLPEPQVVTNGLAGYWHYARGVSGNTWNNIAPDTTGQYNGTITGATLQADGMYFDGVDDFVVIPPMTTLSQGYTIEFLINWDNNISATYPTIFSETTTNRIRINKSTNRLQFTPDTSLVTGVKDFLPNTNSHGLIRYNQSTGIADIFVNGVFDSSYSTTEKTFSNNLYIGVLPSFTNYLKGTVKSLRLYSRALSDSEISQNYAVGTEVGLEEEPPPTGTVYTANLSDSIGFLETVTKRYQGYKNLATDVSTTDIIEKQLAVNITDYVDSINIEDYLSKQLTAMRNMTDIVSTTDIIEKHTLSVRVLNDIVTALESATKQSRLIKQDSVSVESENFNKVMSRTLADNIPTGEEQYTDQENSARLNDVILSADTVQKVSTQFINFLDSVEVDDLLILSNSKIKHLTDIINISDSMSKTLFKTYIDKVSPADTKSQEITRAIIDSLAPVDSVAILKVKLINLLDSIISHDTVRLSQGKLYVDSVKTSDTKSQSASRALNDNTNIADIKNQEAIKSVLDSLNVADSISSARSKLISLLDSINTEESSSMALAKTYLDSVAATDTKSQEIIRTIVDSLDPADSINLAIIKLISLTDSIGSWDNLTATKGKVIPTTKYIPVSVSLSRSVEIDVKLNTLIESDVQLTRLFEINLFI